MVPKVCSRGWNHEIQWQIFFGLFHALRFITEIAYRPVNTSHKRTQTASLLVLENKSLGKKKPHNSFSDLKIFSEFRWRKGEGKYPDPECWNFHGRRKIFSRILEFKFQLMKGLMSDISGKVPVFSKMRDQNSCWQSCHTCKPIEGSF